MPEPEENRKKDRRLKILRFVRFILLFTAAVLIAVLISSQVPEVLIGMGFSEESVVPLIEEGGKLACFGVFILVAYDWKKEANLLWTLLLSALFFGLVFGFIETAVSEAYSVNFLTRLKTSIPAHGIWTALACTGLFLPLKNYRENKKLKGLWILPITYIIAAILHRAWNAFTPQEIMQWFFWPIIGLLIILISMRVRIQ